MWEQAEGRVKELEVRAVWREEERPVTGWEGWRGEFPSNVRMER